MADLERFRKLNENFSDVADFTLVYILEAHPTDGWAFQGNVEVRRHRSMAERYAAAEKMLSMEGQVCPVLVDSLGNKANLMYGARPERLFIVIDGVIVYKGGEGPYGYKIAEVQKWLENYRDE
ncbi:unnamed protein product [Meganyctiphanes norvegica]|uniref:Iodothyronine deiodinase n=1 Tax=Meganyctiphanes norvegica TaxID=48144 RepID=A0AAV2RSU1_MEGNR